MSEGCGRGRETEGEGRKRLISSPDHSMGLGTRKIAKSSGGGWYSSPDQVVANCLGACTP